MSKKRSMAKKATLSSAAALLAASPLLTTAPAFAAEHVAEVTSVSVDAAGDANDNGKLDTAERANVTVGFKIPDSAAAGDTFDFKLPEGYQPSFSGALDVKNANGVNFGQLKVKDTDTLTFTLGEEANGLVDRTASATFPVGGDLNDQADFDGAPIEVTVNGVNSGVAFVIPGRSQPDYSYAGMYGFADASGTVTFGPVGTLGYKQSAGGPVTLKFSLPDGERSQWNPDFLANLSPSRIAAVIDNDVNSNDTSLGGKEGQNAWETNWASHITSVKYVDGQIVVEVDDVPAGYALRTQLPNSAVQRLDVGTDTADQPYNVNLEINNAGKTYNVSAGTKASSVAGAADGTKLIPNVGLKALADGKDANTAADAVTKQVTTKNPTTEVPLTLEIPNTGQKPLKNLVVTGSNGISQVLDGVEIPAGKTYTLDLGKVKLGEGVHTIDFTVTDTVEKVMATDPVVIKVEKLTAPVNTTPDTARVQAGKEITLDPLANDNGGKYKLEASTFKLTAGEGWTGKDGVYTNGKATVTDLGAGKLKVLGVAEGADLKGLTYTVANELGDVSAATPITLSVFDYHVGLVVKVADQDANTVEDAYKVVIPVGEESSEQELTFQYTNPGTETVTVTHFTDAEGNRYDLEAPVTLAGGEEGVFTLKRSFPVGATELVFNVHTTEGASATDPAVVKVGTQGVTLKAEIDGHDANTVEDAYKITIPHNQQNIDKRILLPFTNPGTEPITVVGFKDQAGTTYTLDEPVTLAGGEAGEFYADYRFTPGTHELNFEIITEEGVTAMDPVVVVVEQEEAPAPAPSEEPVVEQEKPAEPKVEQAKPAAPAPIVPETGAGYTVEAGEGVELVAAGDTASAPAASSGLLGLLGGLVGGVLGALGFQAYARKKNQA